MLHSNCFPSISISLSWTSIFYSVFSPPKVVMSVTTSTPSTWLWLMVFLLISASWTTGTKYETKSVKTLKLYLQEKTTRCACGLTTRVRKGSPGHRREWLVNLRVSLDQVGSLENMEGFTPSREGTWGKEKSFFILFYQQFLFFRFNMADMELIALIKRTCTGSKGPRHLFVTLCG